MVPWVCHSQSHISYNLPQPAPAAIPSKREINGETQWFKNPFRGSHVRMLPLFCHSFSGGFEHHFWGQLKGGSCWWVMFTVGCLPMVCHPRLRELCSWVSFCTELCEVIFCSHGEMCVAQNQPFGVTQVLVFASICHAISGIPFIEQPNVCVCVCVGLSLFMSPSHFSVVFFPLFSQKAQTHTQKHRKNKIGLHLDKKTETPPVWPVCVCVCVLFLRADVCGSTIRGWR